MKSTIRFGMLSSSGALCRSWTVVGTALRVGTSQRVHRAINQQHSRQPRFQTTPPLLAFTRRERLAVQRRATVHCAAEASAELTSPVEGPPSSKQGAFTQVNHLASLSLGAARGGGTCSAIPEVARHPTRAHCARDIRRGASCRPCG